MALKLYTDTSLNDETKRNQLNPLLRAHWNARTPKEREKMYGPRATLFELVPSIKEADLCVLTMELNYFWERGMIARVSELAAQAKMAGKYLLVWTEGDYDRILPYENVIHFQAGPHNSYPRRTAKVYAFPAFIDDYIDIYFGGTIKYREKGAKPVVGFCGQAAGSLANSLMWVAKTLRFRLLRWKNRKLHTAPPPIVPPWITRSRILRVFEQTDLTRTNFIIRNRYWAGVPQSERDGARHRSHQAKVQFVNNIVESDYVLCYRGTGNFSKRLYETLCLGRIPIFVNTDCTVPYDFSIDWKKYVVWVEPEEVPQIAEIVASHYAQLDKGEFKSLQEQCRSLWQERLSTNGFFGHFMEHFSDVNLNAESL